MTISKILRSLGLTVATVASGCVILQSSPAQAIQLVTNGDFETGDLTGWNATGFTSVINGANGTQTARLGPATLSLIPPFSRDGSLSQSLTTSVGQLYQLSFDLGINVPGSIGNVRANVIDSSSNVTSLLSLGPAFSLSSALNPYSYSFIGTGSDTVSFSFENAVAPFQLDNVSVTGPSATAVPEPFTIVGTIIGGTAALRMRKKLSVNKKV